MTLMMTTGEKENVKRKRMKIENRDPKCLEQTGRQLARRKRMRGQGAQKRVYRIRANPLFLPARRQDPRDGYSSPILLVVVIVV